MQLVYCRKMNLQKQGKQWDHLRKKETSIMPRPLLQINDLHVHFPIKENILKRNESTVKAVNGVSLSVQKGSTLGIVGESGCGKSTLARSIIGLERPTSGEILFKGENIQHFRTKELHQLKRNIQMVFQDPFTSLNPRMNVGEIIAAPLKAFKTVRPVKTRVKELMELVGLKPDEHYH